MIDFFGYNKTVAPIGQIVTSEFASVSANGQMSLVQSVQMQYNRNINSMFEAGSSTIYYIGGNSEGHISLNAAVGKSGFFKNFRNLQASCGQVTPMTIDLLTGGACSVGGTGGVSFTGALAEGFSIAYQAGPVAVTEGATIRVASMTVR